MQLEGSCHCGAVHFSVVSHTPYPFNLCYCSTCRKTNGGGGYAINIMGEADTLRVTGMEHVSVYRSKQNDRGAYEADGLGFTRRHFCKHCGSLLWLHNPKYPQSVYPCASAIDTPLPTPPEHVALMLDYRPGWAWVPTGPNDAHYPRYPEGGIEVWHRKRGLYGAL